MNRELQNEKRTWPYKLVIMCWWWHSRWVVKRACHPTYWITHTPTGQDKVLHRSRLQHVPADINWTKEKSQESSRMVDPGTMGSPPMAPPTATPPPERSDRTSPPSQPDIPTLTTPMVRADPSSPPATDIPTGTDVSTPAAPPLVLKFSRKDRPGVTTRNQEWTVKPLDTTTVEVKRASLPTLLQSWSGLQHRYSKMDKTTSGWIAVRCG